MKIICFNMMEKVYDWFEATIVPFVLNDSRFWNEICEQNVVSGEEGRVELQKMIR